jgi:hypothetical protein
MIVNCTYFKHHQTTVTIRASLNIQTQKVERFNFIRKQQFQLPVFINSVWKCAWRWSLSTLHTYILKRITFIVSPESLISWRRAGSEFSLRSVHALFSLGCLVIKLIVQQFIYFVLPSAGRYVRAEGQPKGSHCAWTSFLFLRSCCEGVLLQRVMYMHIWARRGYAAALCRR